MKEFDKFMNYDYISLSEWLFSLNQYEFSLIASILANLIAKNLTTNEQNSLGNFFELIGQTLLTISAQATTLKSNNK